MATYLEIRQLFSDGDLKNRAVTATVIAANNLLSGTPTAADKSFADAVFNDPVSVGEKVLMSILAANKNATVAQIQNASDAALQTNVDAVIPSLVDAMAGV